MSKIIKHKSVHFTMVNNSVLQNPNLSLKAKGLHALLFSFPDGWDYSVSGLTPFSKDGKDGITSAIKELENAKLLIRKQCINERNVFTGYDYIIFDVPFTENPSTGTPSTEKPFTENPLTENPLQNNTIENKTIENNTIENNIKENGEPPIAMTDSPRKDKPSIEDSKPTRKSKSRKEFIPPTVEEVRKYCDEKGYSVDAVRFIEYYSDRNWKDSLGRPVLDWKQRIISTWSKNSHGLPKTPEEIKRNKSERDYWQSKLRDNGGDNGIF